MQSDFFPIDIANEEPFTQTSDLRRVGWDMNGVQYAIRAESDSPLGPLTEWICYHLCRACAIPTPGFDIVRCLNGELAFGSRWEATAKQIGQNFQYRSQQLDVLRQHATPISAALTLDAFLPNIDRHAGNWLFVIRNNMSYCLAFDFSQAGARMYAPPKPPFGTWPMPPSVKTQRFVEVFSTFLDRQSADRVNGALAAISTEQFERILRNAPEEWFTLVSLSELVEWWENDARGRIPT